MALTDSTARFSQGVMAQEAGDWPEAVAAFSAVVAAEPVHLEAWQRRAAAHAALGDNAAAIVDLTELIRLKPRVIAHYLARARHKHHLGDVAAALADLNAAHGLEPRNAEVLLERARFFASHDAHEAALLDCQRALRLKPAHDAVLAARARSYLALALAAAAAAVPLEGIAGDQEACYGHALDDIAAAIAINPLPAYALERAEILESAAAWEDALDQYDQVLKTLRSGSALPDAGQLEERARRGKSRVIRLKAGMPAQVLVNTPPLDPGAVAVHLVAALLRPLPTAYTPASPAVFPRMDQAFYEHANLRLSRLGFRALGDFVLPADAAPALRPALLRLYLSRSGKVAGSVYEAWLRDGIPAFWPEDGSVKGRKIVSFYSELDNGQFVITANLASTPPLALPDTIDFVAAGGSIGTRKLAALHTERVRQWRAQHPSVAERVFTSAADVALSHQRLHALRGQQRRVAGGMSASEARAVFGADGAAVLQRVAQRLADLAANGAANGA